ncbi:hypothetical protein DES49_1535 [Halospina denitrificans]|uniref:DUF6792 domain-containing protein n=1 Tax=Halospina denitrificans TaxID=332522 RepID=A0A4V3EQD5_9GAMM|nr:DUF6792 domain-containing protein [Halospina denitrificans]TDT41448.1 hypothetical protein DES49_1535 [Halospina denitrificans]
MSEFTKSAFEASLLSVVVYNDQISETSDSDDLIERLSGSLSETEINYFIDNFEIVSTSPNFEGSELDDSGYQGMLVKRKGSDDDGSSEYWFVNRGTEMDSLEGLFQDGILADGGVFLQGEASYQLAAMTSYFNDVVVENEDVPADATIYAAGHSLGGHLTTLLADAYDDTIEHAYTFNGAGVDSLPDTESEQETLIEQIYQSVADSNIADTVANIFTQTFQSNQGHDNVSNFVTTEGLEVVPATNSLLGEIYRVATEEGWHGSGNLAHSLFAHHMISEFDSSLSIDDIGQILNESSNTGEAEHDTFIKGISEILGFDTSSLSGEASNDTSDGESDINESHLLLSEVASQYSDQGFKITPLDSVSSSDLMDQLNADTTQGAVARYSVLNNLSFLVEGDFSDVTPSFMDNEAYTDPSQYSEAFWADKLDALSLMLSRNSEDGDNGDVSEPGETIYDDRLGEDEVYGDGVSEVWYPRTESPELKEDITQQVVFGTHDDDSITTGTKDDRVYGLDGNDDIKTGEGNDQVEAGAGNDEVDGGAGIDALDGGSGHGRLHVLNTASSTLRWSA